MAKIRSLFSAPSSTVMATASSSSSTSVTTSIADYNSTSNGNEEEILVRVNSKTDTPRYHRRLFFRGTQKPHRLLCEYHQLPEWQKDNDFILGGYVRETKSFWHCVDTLCFLNNESLNIFSHLLPGTIIPLLMAIFIPYLLVHENFISYIPPWLIHLPKFTTTEASDYNIFFLFFMGFTICLSCSATFHMLKVHSEKVASMGSCLDYAGILWLIASSLIGIIHYAFIDHQVMKNAFVGITSVAGIVSLLITWHPDFRTSQWRHIRTSTFVTFAFSGLIPICYAFIKFGFSMAADRTGLKYVALEGLSYLTGAAIYAFRLPERFSPGRYDLIGHSHQIFHCLVVAGAYWHFRALVHAYIVAKSTTLGGHIVN